MLDTGEGRGAGDTSRRTTDLLITQARVYGVLSSGAWVEDANTVDGLVPVQHPIPIRWEEVLDIEMLPWGGMMIITPSFHGTYNHISACPSGGPTAVQNADGPNHCVCPEGQYNDGSGTCSPCRQCANGEYTEAQCTQSQNTVCRECRHCGAGEWISRECEPAGADTACTPCATMSCAAGQWVAGGCTGTEKNDSLTCLPCGQCPVDHYLVSTNGCDGATTEKTSPTCSPCGKPGGCGEGQYRHGRCNGTGTTNTETCADCPLCPVGQFWHKGCDGTGFSPDEAVCRPCDQCPAGSYIESYQSCLGFRTTPTAYSCKNCTKCENGFRHAPTCSGTTTSDVSCVKCDLVCKPGERVATDPETSQCKCEACKTNCGRGEFRNPVGCPGHEEADDACVRCTTADACQEEEEYLFEQGTCDGNLSYDSRECATCSLSFCPRGQWADVARCNSTAPFQSWCRPCSRSCPLGKYRTAPCNSVDRDIVCASCTTAPCPLGQYEVSPCDGLVDRKCQTCTECMWPHFYDSNPGGCKDGIHDRKCTRCRAECPPGQIELETCTRVSDTICGPAIGECQTHPHPRIKLPQDT